MAQDAVTVLIPTLDEAATIGTVIDGFREAGYDSIVIIDGGSTDGTRSVASEHGAAVIEQAGTGKGRAVREGIDRVDAEIVLLVDGDGTYDPAEADALCEPIRSGRAEHVIGNRFGDMHPGAMTRLNRVGNRLINRLFARIHGKDFVDILSGYRAFTTASVERFRLRATGFGIETELAVECAKHGVPTEVVPVSYRPRPDGSDTNLHPLRDGAVILSTLYRLAKTNNPLFYFGSLGVGSLFIGIALGLFVAYDWFVRNISHEVMAVVAGVALLFGVQLIMFGVLSDMILALNREQFRRLR